MNAPSRNGDARVNKASISNEDREKAEDLDNWAWTSWVRVGRDSWRRLNETFWRVPVDVRTERIKICRNCEEFIARTTQCRVCWCAMAFKTWYGGFSCPKSKWQAVSRPETAD